MSTRNTPFSPEELYTTPETTIIHLSTEAPVLQGSNKGFPISDWQEE